MSERIREMNWYEVKKFVESEINRPFTDLMTINGEGSTCVSSVTISRIGHAISSFINESIEEIYRSLPSKDIIDIKFRSKAINESIKILANSEITLDKDDKNYVIRLRILRAAMKFNYSGEE